MIGFCYSSFTSRSRVVLLDQDSPVAVSLPRPRGKRTLNPRALTPEFLHKAGYTTMPAKGIHSVTVPGAVDGWARMHERYGKLPWKDLFQSAILYAEQGFPVTEIIQGSWVACVVR
jgi:hypothetical protein